MSWNVYEIARLHLDGVILKLQSCRPFEHANPFVLILVVPESVGRGVAVGDDSFDANVRGLGQRVGKFIS